MPEKVDERDDLDHITEGHPRTVSTAVFMCLSGCLTVVILFSLIAADAVASKRLGVQFDGGWVIWLGVPLFGLFSFAIDRILKRMGLSRSGKTVEIVGRTIELPAGESHLERAVELRCPRSLIAALGVVCLVFGLLVGLIVALTPRDQARGIAWAYAVIGCIGLAAAYCLDKGRQQKLQAWADSSGIAGCPVGLPFRARFVPWSEVATCVVETHYNTFGKLAIVRPILMGWNGEILIVLNLMNTQIADQERLVSFIKAKLPKPIDNSLSVDSL